MEIKNLWSTPPRRASKGSSSNKRKGVEAKGYGLTRPANHYTLASCPPSKTRRHVYWKGGIVNKRYDEPVVYASKQLATTRHKIPVLYPNDVLPNPGQRITLTNSGERGTMVGWAKDDHQPVARLDNGSYAAFTPQAWLPEVIVKGKRHLPADDLDKLFLGIMAAPLTAYGMANGLWPGIGGSFLMNWITSCSPNSNSKTASDGDALDDSILLTSKRLAKETQNTPVKYIGGNSNEARKMFWKQEPVFQHAADSISREYGLMPGAYKQRLSHEGFVDGMIHRINDSLL